jgi:hypothetical protein
MSFWQVVLAGVVGGLPALVGVMLSLRHERARHVSARMLEDRHQSIRQLLEAEKQFYFSMATLLTSHATRPTGVTLRAAYDEYFSQVYKMLDRLIVGSVYAHHREDPETQLLDIPALLKWLDDWVRTLMTGADQTNLNARLLDASVVKAGAELPKFISFFEQLRTWAVGELSPEGLAILSRESLRPGLWARLKASLRRSAAGRPADSAAQSHKTASTDQSAATKQP